MRDSISEDGAPKDKGNRNSQIPFPIWIYLFEHYTLTGQCSSMYVFVENAKDFRAQTK